jgi:cobyrinic acid a,c-diamide synthase
MAKQLCIMIAGVSSGVGKTTVATGLMHALVARGLRVQGFKVGPDYIDPTYHRSATGRPSYNLDTWLNGPEDVLRCFASGMRDADIAIIEGVMGLFDGRKQTRDDASSAEMARLLDVPVFLVVDASRMGQSVAAVIHGYQHLDPRVHIAGVILNQVASENHESILRYAIAAWTNVPIVGVIYRGQMPSMPARHLGLVPTSEHQLDLQQLGNVIEHTIQIDQLLASARQIANERPLRNDAPAEQQIELPLPLRREQRPYRLGLALDRAFSFYYPEVLEHFTARGIEVVPFSPLDDTVPPHDIDVCYLGGGFPEIFAAQLSANESMLAGLRSMIAGGTRIYAECGGYMYLGKACIDQEGISHPLLGVVPYEFRMGKQRAQLGYREIMTRRATLLGPANMHLRGHEFHWSSIKESLLTEHTIYEIQDEKGYTEEGFADHAIVASYIHLPFKSFVSVLTNLFDLGPRYVENRP